MVFEKGHIPWNKEKSGLYSKAIIKKMSESAKKRKRLFLNKICPVCKKEFVDKTANNIGKFCSFKCRDKQYNSQRKKYIRGYNRKNRERINLRQKKWVKTPKGKEAIKRSRIKNKAKRLEWLKKYRQIPAVLEKINLRKKEYLHTYRGRAKARYYNQRRRINKKGIIEGYTRKEFL